MFALGIGALFQAILNAIGAASGITDDVTLENILFTGANADTISIKTAELLNVNFFNLSSGDDVANAFRTAVAQWYYVMRLISAAILLVILLYVGIRMALSTIAQEQAKYKQMLVDWITSISLLFLLHYIIIFVITVNSSLVDALSSFLVLSDNKTVGQQMDDVLTSGGLWEPGLDNLINVATYCGLKFMSFMMLVFYMKRMITIGFLIIIAPLITITYAIDKIGDGKAQALNAWLKEFIYNILIQPFHIVIYLAFFGAVSTLLTSANGITASILGILIIWFMHKAEDILRKIFHFEANSMSGLGETTQNVLNASGTFAKGGALLAKGTVGLAKGGAAVARDANRLRKSISAGRKLKKEYNKDTNLKEEHKSWKDYKNSQQGIERKMELMKASILKEKLDKAKNDRIERRARKNYDNQPDSQKVKNKYGKVLSFDDLAIIAKQKDKDGKPTKEATQAQNVLNGARDIAKKEIKNSMPNRTIRGISKVSNTVGGAVHKFTQSETGKFLKAGLQDSIKAASTIAFAAGGLLGGGHINDAVSLGQMGYGIADGLLQSTTNTIKDDTADYMKKYNEITGCSAEQTAENLDMINENGNRGDYKDMDSKKNKAADEVAALGVDLSKIEKALDEIQRQIADPKKKLDIKSQIDKLGITDNAIRGKVENIVNNYSQLVTESYIYSDQQKAEAMGMDLNAMNIKIQKKVSRFEKHIENHENVTEETYENGERVN